jgi:pimeloyl-ACP methyl ester carboxylesterase
VTGALLILSPKPGAVIAMVVAIGLAAAAAWLRLRQPSHVDVFLNASAWTLIGFALAWVVGWAVFAPGRITYHRVMGAILLYLAIGLTFVALNTFVALAAPDAVPPLLVIFGSQDALIPASSAKLFEAVPGARVEVVDGAGHSPVVEAPEKTLALISDFLSNQ